MCVSVESLLWFESVVGECSVSQARFIHTVSNYMYMKYTHRSFAVFFPRHTEQLLRRCSISDIVAVYQPRTANAYICFVLCFFLHLYLSLIEQLCVCVYSCVDVWLLPFGSCIFICPLFISFSPYYFCLIVHFLLFFPIFLALYINLLFFFILLFFVPTFSVSFVQVETTLLFSFYFHYCIGFGFGLYWIFIFVVNFVIFSHAQPSNTAKQVKHTHLLYARS